jgi:hypothetical protein
VNLTPITSARDRRGWFSLLAVRIRVVPHRVVPHRVVRFRVVRFRVSRFRVWWVRLG